MLNGKDDRDRRIYVSDIKSGIIHYFFVYIFILLISFLMSFTYANKFIKHKYTSVGLLSASKYQNVPALNTLATIPKNDEVLIKVVEELNAEGHYKLGNIDLTPNFLNSNLRSQYMSNSLNVRVSLTIQHKEMSIVIVNKVLDVSKTFANENYETYSSSIVVAQYANGTTQTGESKSLILSLGMMFGIMICAVHLYYKLFLSNAISSTFLLDKEKVDYVNSKRYQTINRKPKGDYAQLSAEIILNQMIKSKISSIGLFSLDKKSYINDLLINLGTRFSNNGFKVLMIDLFSLDHKNDVEHRNVDYDLISQTLTKLDTNISEDAPKNKSNFNIKTISDNLVQVNCYITYYDLLGEKKKSFSELLNAQSKNYDLIIVYSGTIAGRSPSKNLLKEFDYNLLSIAKWRSSEDEVNNFIKMLAQNEQENMKVLLVENERRLF